MEWDLQKIHAGHVSITMTYHIALTILNLTLYPLIQLEKLSFLLAMAMRFVNECDNKIRLIKLMTKKKTTHLGWVVLGVWCFVV